ncbi:bifunctional response regulator/alkaline phosphatase family protein [Porphyromonas pogonae]|uniref:T9SS response regulator signal transducer PorX n=1 Tax=Porphyromonas pogonae TaxID=867595 RepID=UPI002E77C82E|nr:bifunctional response regulator/alkaline phosphatase family protein [Porphyromonas pogonae]
MKEYHILWADDEIDLLKPHILFIEKKGYKVTPVLSGADAVEAVKNDNFDLIFLDENMPGLTGLDTLQVIKELKPYIPVVMVTKSEEEQIMNQAIGGKIADYLIKPVNPNQLLLSLKKNLHQSTILTQTATENYRQEFTRLGAQISDTLTLDEWKDLYKRLVYWEIELEENAQDMGSLLEMQKAEAGRMFSRFVKNNYESWLNASQDKPVMSPDLFKHKVFPLLDNGEKVFFILIDNFRLDQWATVKDMLSEFYTFEEDLYVSILPTATQYARNSIFSGLMPLDIEKMFPELWIDEESEEGKNLNEEPMIRTLLDRYRKPYKFSYNKVYETRFSERLLANISQLKEFPLNVIVLNFVDMLSHARTESKMIRELASSEAAYRSLTRSWFKHSTTYNLFKRISEMGYRVILTTDHGTIRVKNPVKIVGDKNTNTNLRYKIGKSLGFNPKEVFEISNPAKIGLPQNNISDKFVFCLNDDFFAYPNNYNYYVQYYKDTFQHGGVSMEEMLVPIITMQPK